MLGDWDMIEMLGDWDMIEMLLLGAACQCYPFLQLKLLPSGYLK